MNDADLQAELKSIADLQSMARSIQDGLQLGDSLPIWRQRRHGIALLRNRVRAGTGISGPQTNSSSSR